MFVAMIPGERRWGVVPCMGVCLELVYSRIGLIRAFGLRIRYVTVSRNFTARIRALAVYV